jgi:hypothetical protein
LPRLFFFRPSLREPLIESLSLFFVQQVHQFFHRILRLWPRLHEVAALLQEVAEFFLVTGIAGGLALFGELDQFVGVIAAPFVHGQFLIDAQRLNVFLLFVGDHETRRQSQVAQGVEGIDERVARLESLAKAKAAEAALRLLGALGVGLLRLLLTSVLSAGFAAGGSAANAIEQRSRVEAARSRFMDM